MTLNGGGGADYILHQGTRGATINGGGGDDVIIGGPGGDTIDGGDDNDGIDGGGGDDRSPAARATTGSGSRCPR